MSAVSQAAQALAAEYGLPVFPCSQNKKPLTSHGLKDATCDAEQIARWFDNFDDALIGVPTGAASKLLVIDIDPNGSDWYRSNVGRLAAGRVHKTRRGHHLIYRMPSEAVRNSASRIAPGVDVRGEGGYIIFWPAHGLNATGDLADVSEPPAWLIELLKSPAAENKANCRRADDVADTPAGVIVEGRRNATLASFAGRLRRAGSGEEEIRIALRARNLQCSPPLREIEVDAIAASISKYSAPDPEPLRRVLPPAESYPTAALGPILGEAAKRIHSVLSVPPAMAGQSVLAAASLAAQALADVLIDGRREPLSLWHLTIGVSGERKSACDQLALRAHREHERVELEEYSHSKLDFERMKMAHEVAVRAAGKGKDRRSIASQIESVGDAPQPPLKPLLLIGSPTIEGVHKQLATGKPSIGLFHDDAGEFLGGYSMSAEHRIKSAAGLSRLWDLGEFDRVRAVDGADKHYGKRLASHLMLQPVIAETVLGDDILVGQGFLARSLMCWPASTIGTRSYVETDLSTDAIMVMYWDSMRTLLRTQPDLRPGKRNELEPRTLRLSPAAKIAWKGVYEAIERDMAEDGEYFTIRAWASKAPAQALRISGVLALVEEPQTGVVAEDHITRAALLVSYYLSEAVRIVGTNSVSPTVRNAEALLAWCHQTPGAPLHSRAAIQFGPPGIRSKDRFDAAVAELERCGWAVPIEGGALVEGRHRRRVWTIRSAARAGCRNC